MPYAKIILGPKYQVRVQDLTAADVMVVKCFNCEQVWRIAPHQLHNKFRPSERLLEIGRRFICRKCKSTECSWHVERASVLAVEAI